MAERKVVLISIYTVEWGMNLCLHLPYKIFDSRMIHWTLASSKTHTNEFLNTAQPR